MNPRRALSLIPAAIGFGVGSFRRGIQAGLDGRWEGAEQSRYRNRPGRALESVDWGVNYGVREGMLSEARNLEQTYAICRGINRKYADYCIGSCRMKWDTGDDAIDKAYRDGWQTWMKMADVTGRHVFKKMSKITAQRVIADGRVFAQLDRRGGFLQLLGIEGDRVSSDGIFNADRQGLVSGIGIDDNGRAKYFKVWERSLYGTFINFKEIPANQMVHVFDTDRFDSVSGVTHYASVLNTIRDLLETAKAERLSAKRNSKLALLVKTIMGGATVPAVDLFDTESVKSGDAKVNVQRVSDIADAYMFPNEDIKAHTADRPSEGWRWLLEWMVREISVGLGLPFGVVWHMAGLGGPAVRFEINSANRTFMAFLQDVIEPMWFRPIVSAWLSLEIDQGRLPFHPNWYKFKCPRPKSITIDLGRDSKAGIAENVAGLSTATDWYAEEDEEFEAQTDRLVYEARYREASRLGVPIDQVKEVPLEQIRIVTPQGNPAFADAPGGDEPEAQPQKKAA